MMVRRVVNQLFASNSYILYFELSNCYWLIDIGDTEAILSFLPANANVSGVLLTHTHFDHIYGLNALMDYYPECEVFTSEHGKEGLFSEKLNYSKYNGNPFVFKGKRVRLLKDGDSVFVDSINRIDVYETPGHDWSCLTYCKNDMVFSGDSYLPGVKVFTKLLRGDKEQAAISEQRIIDISRGKTLYPGHGDPVL